MLQRVGALLALDRGSLRRDAPGFKISLSLSLPLGPSPSLSLPRSLPLALAISLPVFLQENREIHIYTHAYDTLKCFNASAPCWPSIGEAFTALHPGSLSTLKYSNSHVKYSSFHLKYSSFYIKYSSFHIKYSSFHNEYSSFYIK